MKERNFKWKHYTNYILLASVLLVFFLLHVTGGLGRYEKMYVSLFTQIGYSIMLAVSLNLVVGFLGELSLGHAGFMCIGAFIGGLTYNTLIPVFGSTTYALLIALPVGGLAAAVFGLLIGLPALRLKGDYLAIVTLAFGEIVRTVIYNQSIFGGPRGFATQKFGNMLYLVAFIGAILTVVVSQNLRRSKHGRAIQAIRDNEIAARAMGVNVTFYKLAVFVIAAFFAGMAGVIYTGNTTLVKSTEFSFNYSINILVMVVLGGMGNITGSILSSAILTFITVQLTANLSGDLAAIEPLVYALILIIAVMWNNAPFLRPVREKFNAKLTEFRHKLFHRHHADGGVEGPENAVWDKIPTKIPMDALLSTDFTPDHTFEADRPGKEDGK